MQCTEVLPGIDADHKPLCRNFESVAFIFCTGSLDELISRIRGTGRLAKCLQHIVRTHNSFLHQAEKEALWSMFLHRLGLPIIVLVPTDPSTNPVEQPN